MFRFAAAICLISLCVLARGESLVRVGETCLYYKAYDLRGLLKAGWEAPEFDESRWLAAPSSYVFDDPQFEKRLRPGLHPGYAYVRKKFVVADVSKIKSLVLRVEFERAVVAYLNGVRIARGPKNPAQPLPPGEVPRGFPTSPDGEFDLTQSIGLLKNGENLLALEGPFSSEAYQAMPIAACILANITRGPFIQNSTATSVQVFWRTFVPGNSILQFGTTPSLGTQIDVAAPVTAHVFTLTNLSAGQKYFYRVQSDTPKGPIISGVESFTTLKNSGPIQFVVFGDSGQGTTAQTKIADVIRRANPDLVLHCGDLVYQNFNDRSVDWRLFNYYQPHMARVPYFMVPGNHDLNCCVGDGEADYNPTNWFLNATNFQNSFFLPTNSATGTKHFYSFDAGDAHFVGLYNPWFADYVFSERSEQFHWLTNDLAHSSKPWKFIFMHMPLATSGGHVGRDDNANSINDSAELMRLLLPIAERYGIDVIFGGHDHNFERFVPTNGLHHLVTGGGGGTVYEMKQRHPASAQFWAIHHCIKVAVDGETARIEALDKEGSVFDSFTINRTPTSDRLYLSWWHTPQIDPQSSSDGDGNFVGQKFDFSGDPILTRSGRASSLGRLYVNNDAETLYIGFSGVMLYGDQTVMLFIELPHQSGVTNLIGLGNGRIDPRGQGVDGLDFLENLSFTNFAPSIGCVLGDEFADGQFRDFKRPEAPFNTGQGIFRLDREFSNVRGARLQQFNRSPQRGIVPGESSADFIELAIPFASLGNLQPSETIKLGAVVTGGQVNTSEQSRPIDTSLLGTALLSSGDGRTVLQPIRVQLATAPPR